MSHQNLKPRKNAALLIIGDEILSGQTRDENIHTIALFCTNIGIDLKEVRIAADELENIIITINELRKNYDYVFSTGGIGPTHDDITADAIAKAFNVELEINADAKAMLLNHNGDKQLSEGRLRMARIPKGATLIKNNVTGAPGFIIENVYAMAGVPIIMQDMLKNIAPLLVQGERILSNKIMVGVGESKIALGLEKIQKAFENVKIGSYPQMGKFSSIILRSNDKIALEKSTKLVQSMVDELHVENNIILPSRI
ncbi:MAG: molybdopterin-binding protein [Devosiaceae bacterium]|nr:molybdopterin-binding protein [Devosiaceae bacterium]